MENKLPSLDELRIDIASCQNQVSTDAARWAQLGRKLDLKSQHDRGKKEQPHDKTQHARAITSAQRETMLEQPRSHRCPLERMHLKLCMTGVYVEAAATAGKHFKRPSCIGSTPEPRDVNQYCNRTWCAMQSVAFLGPGSAAEPSAFALTRFFACHTGLTGSPKAPSPTELFAWCIFTIDVFCLH